MIIQLKKALQWIQDEAEAKKNSAAIVLELKELIARLEKYDERHELRIRPGSGEIVAVAKEGSGVNPNVIPEVRAPEKAAVPTPAVVAAPAPAPAPEPAADVVVTDVPVHAVREESGKQHHTSRR